MGSIARETAGGTVVAGTGNASSYSAVSSQLGKSALARIEKTDRYIAGDVLIQLTEMSVDQIMSNPYPTK